MLNIESLVRPINREFVPQFEEKLRADNVVLEVEHGETEGEQIGNGVITALSLINNLEINEETLYGRMENIEQSTLVT